MGANANLYETVRLHLDEDPTLWIRRLRAEGWTYPDIAEELHVSHSLVVSRMTLTRWDKGRPSR